MQIINKSEGEGQLDCGSTPDFASILVRDALREKHRIMWEKLMVWFRSSWGAGLLLQLGVYVEDVWLRARAKWIAVSPRTLPQSW